MVLRVCQGGAVAACARQQNPGMGCWGGWGVCVQKGGEVRTSFAGVVAAAAVLLPVIAPDSGLTHGVRKTKLVSLTCQDGQAFVLPELTAALVRCDGASAAGARSSANLVGPTWRGLAI